MKKLLFVFLLMCDFVFSTENKNAHAQERLTLEDAVTKALEHNFDIRVAELDAQTASTNNTLGNAGFLPNVNGNGFYNISSLNAKNQFSNGTSQERTGAVTKNFGGGVNADFRLFAAGKAYILKKQLSELEAIGAEQLKLQIQTTVSQVIQAYAQTVLQHQQIIAIDTGLALAKVRMLLSKMQYEVGLSAKVDFLQARVDYNARQSDSLNLIAATNGMFADLNSLIGEDPEKTYVVDDSLNLNDALTPTQKELLQDRNLSISIAKRTWNASKLGARAAKADMLPTIDLTGGYNFNKTQSQAGFSLFNQSYGPSAGATLNIPIFQGGNLRRIAKVAGLQAMRDEILYEKQNTEIARQYRRAWTDYEISLAAYHLEKENINYAKENVDIQKARFKVGIATTIETREAENGYVEALVRLYTAAYNLKVNETRVLELENRLVE